MTVTGYFTTNATGQLTDDSVLTIEGVGFPIPARAQVGGRLAPRRLMETYHAAGYRAATDYYSDLGQVEDGRATIQLRPINGGA